MLRAGPWALGSGRAFWLTPPSSLRLSRGPQWFRSSGIPRDVSPEWRYASLNRSYCNLFSVQRGFFWETASHFLHLFGKLKSTLEHAGIRACASAGFVSQRYLLSFLFCATACFHVASVSSREVFLSVSHVHGGHNKTECIRFCLSCCHFTVACWLLVKLNSSQVLPIVR